MKLLTNEQALLLSPRVSPVAFWEAVEREDQGLLFRCYDFCVRNAASGGSEVLVAGVCEAFSDRFCALLRSLGCGSILVGHYSFSRRWCPPRSQLERSDESRATLCSRARAYLASMELDNHEGGLLLEGQKEVCLFLGALLPYPTVFSYLDLYMFCMDIPLVLQVSHHGSIFAFSFSGDLLAQVDAVGGSGLGDFRIASKRDRGRP